MRKISLCIQDAFATVIDTEDHFALGDLIDYAIRRAGSNLRELEVVINGQEIDLLQQDRETKWNELLDENETNDEHRTFQVKGRF